MNAVAINSTHSNSTFERCIGIGFLLHFACIAIIKTSLGSNEDIWWLSHVALALAGVGYLLQSRRLIHASLIAIFLPHLMWLFDFAVGYATNSFPLRITTYLADATYFQWMATLHHFYLLPILLLTWSIDRKRGRLNRVGVSLESLILAIVLFALLTIVSRFGLLPGSNVNSAFALLPSVSTPWVRATDQLGTTSYLLLLNVIATMLFFLPAYILLSRGGQIAKIRQSER